MHLLAHGLIRAGFAPPGDRARAAPADTYAQAVRTRTRLACQRIEKVLEDANLKLSVVLSDIMGKGSRVVLQAIIDGHAADSDRLASCINTRVKAGRAEVLEALRGHISTHRRASCSSCTWGHIDALDRAIADIEKERSASGSSPFARPPSC